jgi:hypothetical protein
MSEHLDGKAGPRFAAITGSGKPHSCNSRRSNRRYSRHVHQSSRHRRQVFSALSLFGFGGRLALLGPQNIAAARALRRNEWAVECHCDAEAKSGV